jgi:purine-binding chemotaxis protein CheW
MSTLSQSSAATQLTKDSCTDVLAKRYIAFLLGDEQYAIPLLQVKEVIEMSRPTPIPQTPPYFKGVINLRGQVISVIDLRLKLGMAEVVQGPKTAIIILDLPSQEIGKTDHLGVIVDRVYSVVAIEDQDFVHAPKLGQQSSHQSGPQLELELGPQSGHEEAVTSHAFHRSLVTGVAKKDKKLIVILNLLAAFGLEQGRQINQKNKKT